MIRRRPIAVQVMLLVALATLLASGAMMAITLLGPPARNPPTEVKRLVPMLTGAVRAGRGQRLILQDEAPAQPPDMQRDMRLEWQIAQVAKVPEQDVRAYREGRRRGRDGALFDGFVVSMKLEGGLWSVLRDNDRLATLRWQKVTVATIAGVSLAVLLLAWLAMRPIVEPIRRLGQAAAGARAGAPLQLDIPEGPPEVREVALSLADLHARTLDHAQRQAFMLGAIAHDIGTPLARLAFRLEHLPDAQREVAMSEIEVIRDLIADSLTLAKGHAGPTGPVAFGELVKGITAREIASGRDVTLHQCDAVIVSGDCRALERMVQNLIDNALRYGGDARVSLTAEAGHARLIVQDSGPGFPDIAAEELLKPYVTGDASRNSARGGSGLGLALVAQVADRHGGTISLQNPPGGGARVAVALPLASDTCQT